jgi:hypothetical protein
LGPGDDVGHLPLIGHQEAGQFLRRGRAVGHAPDAAASICAPSRSSRRMASVAMAWATATASVSSGRPR